MFPQKTNIYKPDSPSSHTKNKAKTRENKIPARRTLEKDQRSLGGGPRLCFCPVTYFGSLVKFPNLSGLIFPCLEDSANVYKALGVPGTS